MLVKLTDVKHKDYWVNPMYIRAVVPAKGSGCEVFVSFGNTWSTVRSIKVDRSPEEVASWISAAMPAGSGVAGYYAAAMSEEELAEQQAQQAAVAASMAG